jgi:hypothetical protein
MPIEGCGVSAFVIWKDETCSEIDEKETRNILEGLLTRLKAGVSCAGGVEAEVDTTTRAERRRRRLSKWQWKKRGKELGARGLYFILPYSPGCCTNE